MTRARSVLLLTALAALSVAVPRSARADDCVARIALEGVPDPGLERRLTETVRREGGCKSPWVLRVSAAPKGQYMVALWTGSDLETRWATGLVEAETVAALLLRVAVEHRDAASPAPPPSPIAKAAENAQPAPPPAEDPTPWRLRPGVFAGVAYHANAGVGPELGIEVTIGGPHFAVGVAPRGSTASQRGGSMTAVVLPAIFLAGLPASDSLWVGAQVELGVDIERATGAVGGATAKLGATGLSAGIGARLALALGAGWDLALLASVRTSTASATPVTTSTTTQTPGGNNGKGMGMGPPQFTTTTAEDPASVDAANRIGGVSLGATLGVGRVF